MLHSSFADIQKAMRVQIKSLFRQSDEKANDSYDAFIGKTPIPVAQPASLKYFRSVSMRTNGRTLVAQMQLSV